jgi:hypothetical protein
VRVTFGGLAATTGADFEIVRVSDKGDAVRTNGAAGSAARRRAR